MAATRIEPIAVTGVATAGAVLTVTVDRPGDFSTYRLSARRRRSGPLAPRRVRPPAVSDPLLLQGRTARRGFDCVSDERLPSWALDEPEIDYLAKDYASFRRLMLDRMAALAPDWHERNPADLQVALVELLAYVGDRLSYYQDAVATEAYLGTARRRDLGAAARPPARLPDARRLQRANVDPRGRGWRRAGGGAGRNRNRRAHRPGPGRDPVRPRARDRARPRGTHRLRDAGDDHGPRRPQRDPPPPVVRDRVLPAHRRDTRDAPQRCRQPLALGPANASSSRRSRAPAAKQPTPTRPIARSSGSAASSMRGRASQREA